MRQLLTAKKIWVTSKAGMYGNLLVKNRDIVGFGINGEPMYFDRAITPCPSVRFRENTTDILKLREKEQGDWNKLSLEDKKNLFDEVPPTYTKEYQEQVLKRMIDSGHQHITGPGGCWDYEKKRWKD